MSMYFLQQPKTHKLPVETIGIIACWIKNQKENAYYGQKETPFQQGFRLCAEDALKTLNHETEQKINPVTALEEENTDYNTVFESLATEFTTHVTARITNQSLTDPEIQRGYQDLSARFVNILRQSQDLALDKTAFNNFWGIGEFTPALAQG